MLGNDQKTKISFNGLIIAIQWFIMDNFPATSWLFLGQAGFSQPFHIHAKVNFGKKKV